MKRTFFSVFIIFIMVFPRFENVYAQSLRDTFRKWTYETTLNDFNSLQCDIRCTYLSPELLQVWQQSETDQDIANRVNSLITTMQQQNVIIYIVDVDPGRSDLYLLNFEKIHKQSKLFTTDKKSKGYKPKRVTSNLKRKLIARQPYLGAMAFMVEAPGPMFQTLSMETKFEYFEKFDIPGEKDEQKFELQFHFHANGAPKSEQLDAVPGTQEILGRLKVAFSLVNLVTNQNI